MTSMPASHLLQPRPRSSLCCKSDVRQGRRPGRRMGPPGERQPPFDERISVLHWGRPAERPGLGVHPWLISRWASDLPPCSRWRAGLGGGLNEVTLSDRDVPGLGRASDHELVPARWACSYEANRFTTRQCGNLVPTPWRVAPEVVGPRRHNGERQLNAGLARVRRECGRTTRRSGSLGRHVSTTADHTREPFAETHRGSRNGNKFKRPRPQRGIRRVVSKAEAAKHPRTTVVEHGATPRTRYRSAITGRYVKEATARRHPDTTITENG